MAKYPTEAFASFLKPVRAKSASLREAIADYTLRTTATERKVSDLESSLATIKLGASYPACGPPPPHGAHLMPRSANAEPQQSHVPPMDIVHHQRLAYMPIEYTQLRDHTDKGFRSRHEWAC